MRIVRIEIRREVVRPQPIATRRWDAREIPGDPGCSDNEKSTPLTTEQQQQHKYGGIGRLKKKQPDCGSSHNRLAAHEAEDAEHTQQER